MKHENGIFPRPLGEQHLFSVGAALHACALKCFGTQAWPPDLGAHRGAPLH